MTERGRVTRVRVEVEVQTTDGLTITRYIEGDSHATDFEVLPAYVEGMLTLVDIRLDTTLHNPRMTESEERTVRAIEPGQRTLVIEP